MSRFSGPVRSVSNPNVHVGNNAVGSPNNGFVCQSGTLGSISSPPTDALIIIGTANTLAANKMTVTNAALGQASTVTIPDPGAATANFILDTGTNASATFTAATITTLTSTTGTITTLGSTTGTITTLGSTTATLTTANITTDNVTTANITNLKYGATPVAQADPTSCTITAAAGASNTSTVTVQLKDGAGTNLARSMRFQVYASSAADGLTLASAASTGFSVASGGLSLANATAVTTQITAMSSATGGCVLSLLDAGKQTSYLVLVLPNGNKISAQLSSGSYGA